MQLLMRWKLLGAAHQTFSLALLLLPRRGQRPNQKMHNLLHLRRRRQLALVCLRSPLAEATPNAVVDAKVVVFGLSAFQIIETETQHDPPTAIRKQ